MKAHSTLLSAILSFGTIASGHAQCTVTVPGNVIFITEDDSSTAVIQQAVLLCPGIYVSASSSDPVIFLESGAHMNFSGTSKNIYAKAGSTVNGSGIDDTIYYELGANLLIGGINQTFIQCNPLTFDYSLVNTEDCFTVTGIDDPSQERVTLYPTQVTDRLNLMVGDALLGRTFRVMDGMGREVRVLRPDSNVSEVDVSALAAGVYTVMHYRGLWTGRFVKQ